MFKSALSLIAVSILFISSSLAQQRSINMALVMASPESEDTFLVNDPIRFILIVENLGPDVLVAGDSIFVKTPDEEIQFIVLQQGLAMGESDTIVSGNLTIPVDSTMTFNLCSTLSDDPNSQIQLNGNPAAVSYKDPDPSNNAPCNIMTILVEDPNAIENLTGEELSTRLYPNPAIDHVNVESVEGIIKSIRVVNILGAEVANFDGNRQGMQRLNLSKLPSGIYLLNIQTDKGTAVQKLKILR